MRNLWRVAVTLGLGATLALTAAATSAYRASTPAGVDPSRRNVLQDGDLNEFIYLPLAARNRFGPPVETQLKYGAVVADIEHLGLVRKLGFSWAQVFVPWVMVEPVRDGPREWGVVDAIIQAGRRYNVHLLARVDRPPDWAREPGTSPTGPVKPEELDRWSDFLRALAERGDGAIEAYAIWNEPNLAIEWGGLRPDPARYVRILQAAHSAIKQGNPDAVVVSAGMATTGPAGDQPTHMDDLLYIRRMYEAGAKGHFDALGTNPHGFGYPPDEDPTGANGLAFRRVEQQRSIMEEFNDSERGMWAMEVGWLIDPGPACYPAWERDGRLWQQVSPERQRDYLMQAYQYAHNNWPWMKAMILFNLDFGAVTSEAGCPGATNLCQETRFYSLVTRDNPCDSDNPLKFRPAYRGLQTMPKY